MVRIASLKLHNIKTKILHTPTHARQMQEKHIFILLLHYSGLITNKR